MIAFALPFTNAEERSGGTKGVARSTFCNDNSETGYKNGREGAHDLASPHHKLGAVEDPMCILIEVAVFRWVSFTFPDRVLLLEALDDLFKIIIELELYLVCN